MTVAATGKRLWWRRWPVLVAAGVLLAVTMVALSWFSPLFSVREQPVAGARAVSEREILEVSGIVRGTPLLRVDTDEAAQRISQLPRVASARVQRVFPSTIRVTVVERVPAVFVESPRGPHLLDGSGVVFAAERPPVGLPKLVVAAPGAGDGHTRAALAVLTGLPERLRAQVGEVAAPTVSDIKLTLRDGKQVLWGSQDGSARKAENALAVLTRPGKIYDVSSSVPVVRE